MKREEPDYTIERIYQGKCTEREIAADIFRHWLEKEEKREEAD